MKPEFLIIEMYRSLMLNNSFSQYLKGKGYKVEEYSFFKTDKKQFLSKKRYIFREGLCLIQLLFTFFSFRNKKIYCVGGFYAVLLVSKCFNFLFGPSFHIYIYNFYLHQVGEKKLIQSILRFLLNNKYCTLIVQSPGEISYYRNITSYPVYFVPYCADMKTSLPSSQINLPLNEYVFTGGYTNRDYNLALNCAKKMKDIHFVFTLSALNTEITPQNCPSNITLYQDISEGDFEYLLSHSSAVLVPLKKDVGSSGQMLCISAMQNKKAVVYCNLSAVSYYFEEGVSGLPYKMGDLTSICESIKSIMTDIPLRRRLGEKAFLNYKKNFTEENRNKQLYTIIVSGGVQ